MSLLKPPASRGQDHHGLDGSSLCCVLCCSVDVIECVSANESVEWQASLAVQFDEPWNELSRGAFALIRPEQANAPTQKVWDVDGDLRAQRGRADDNACSGGTQRGHGLIEHSQPAAGLDHVLCAETPGQFEQR